MPEKSPKISEIEAQGITRLKQLEPQIDSSVYGKFILNLVRAFAGAAYLVCLFAQRMFKATFAQLAVGDDLELHAKENNITRNPATGATGEVTVYGKENTHIPISTEFISQSGLIFKSDEEGYIYLQSFPVASVNYQSDFIWLDVGAGHGLTRDAPVVLTGFLPENLNGNHAVSGVDNNKIAININSINIETLGIVRSAKTSITITCESTGINTNVAGGEELNINLAGAQKAIVGVDGLTGGAEQETDFYLRKRVLKARSIIDGVFTAPQVELAALSITGNTRAWVVSPEYGVSGGERGKPGYLPRPGEVVTYIVRDDDTSIIPSQTVLSLTKAAVISKGKKPCHTRDDDIFVIAPIVQKVDIVLSGLIPNTPAMRNAVETEFKANMNDWINLGDTLYLKQIEQFILSSQDSAGNKVQNFDLISPSGNINVNSGTLLVAGEIKWQ